MQRGYDAFNTDYGMTCANVDVSVAAAASTRRSAATYVYVDQWPPSRPIPRGGGFSSTQAFHILDWFCATENWAALGSAFPGPTDLQHTQTLQVRCLMFSRGTSTTSALEVCLQVDLH